MNSDSDKCFVCTKDVSDLGLYFEHHYGFDDYRRSNTQKMCSDCKISHKLCDDCLFESLAICTCNKEPYDEPSSIVLFCPCILDHSINDSDPTTRVSNIKEMSKIYFDISGNILLRFLSKYNENIYLMKGCGGCCFNEEELTDLKKLHKSSVTYCAYAYDEVDSITPVDESNEESNKESNEESNKSKNDPDNKCIAIKYMSDVLNEDFIRVAKCSGYDLGSEQAI